MSPGADGREGPSVRDEAIVRVRNEARGIDQEPATISREEARARAAGEVILPDTGQPTSYDEDRARAREILARAEAEAARDRAERADPGTRGMVEARDHAQRAAERAARRQTEDRETDAQLRHDRFPFWADRDRPEPGPTDRPGVIARVHQMQGRTRDRSDVTVREPRPRSRDYPPATRADRGQQR